MSDDRSSSASGSRVSGSPANSCVHDAGGNVVYAAVSRAPGDSLVVRPLCVDPAGVSRASDDSPVVQPLCVGSAARGGPFEVDGLGKSAHATACESEGNLGLHQIIESHSRHNSSWGVDVVACARGFVLLVASASASSSALSPASLAVVAHARSSPMHCAHNSWSDTGRVQGPTGRRCTKGGVSGPAEDLRPVSEVEAGVNFRPAGGVRGQVAGSLPRRQPGTGTRRVREGAVTPSLHLEVPGIHFVSPGYGLDVRQSMG